jgi:predicted nucleotidyltransferase
MKTSKRTVHKALRELQLALGDLYGDAAPSIILYGSQARGDATDASDIDLLLIFPNSVSSGAEIRRISPILADLNMRYQVLISILPASKIEYLTSLTMFWKNVRREGIPVHAA